MLSTTGDEDLLAAVGKMILPGQFVTDRVLECGRTGDGSIAGIVSM